MATPDNTDQATFWNTDGGAVWVAREADLDAMHRSVTEVLLEECAPAPGEAILDIGCGGGATCLAFAEAVGPAGQVLGVDISAPLVARAEDRGRAAGLGNLAFLLADAGTDPLPAGRFDAAVSRFGVMFFADAVAAFRNIGTALRPGGRVAFAAWSGPERNPWFSLTMRIATARLGAVPTPPPGAPGPMAFADRDRVIGLFEAAGFAQVAAETRSIDLHHPGGVPALTDLSTRIGPAARLMREKNGSPEDAAAIAAATLEALQAYASPDGIRIPAEIHVFRAVRP